MAASQKQCPQCNRAALMDAGFCSQCGHQFQTKFAAPAPAHPQCAACGYTLSSFEKNCPRCASAGQLATAQPPPLPAMPHAAPPPPPYAPTVPPPLPYVPAAQAAAMQCVSCRNWIAQGTPQCPYCATVYQMPQPAPYIAGNQAPVQQVIIQNVQPPVPYGMVYRPRKDKTAAGLLGILLGGFGAHHFYLGNNVAGVLSVVFCWTWIPSLIGLVQGVTYLCMDEQEFHRRHG